MFVGFKDYGLFDMTDDRLLYTVDTKIHHVEKYGSIIENIKGEKKKGVDAVIDLETLKTTQQYKDAVEWGKNCQQTYADWKWKHTIGELGMDLGKTYDIKPKSGSDLPFDFDGCGSIDLIVSRIKERGAKKEISPFDILEDFDLTICKASFDGKTFRVPDPHRTFAAKSTMEPNRRAIVESYVKHYKPVPWTEIGMEPIMQSKLASSTIEAVRKDVPNVPFYKQLDFAARLPDHYNPNSDFGRGSQYDPMVQAKYGPSIQFHNWTRKLINRLRKYQKRGIEVVGAPAIGDDVDIDEFRISGW